MFKSKTPTNVSVSLCFRCSRAYHGLRNVTHTNSRHTRISLITFSRDSLSQWSEWTGIGDWNLQPVFKLAVLISSQFIDRIRFYITRAINREHRDTIKFTNISSPKSSLPRNLYSLGRRTWRAFIVIVTRWDISFKEESTVAAIHAQ